MLGRRELSEAQVRQRLARRGHAEDDIETALAFMAAGFGIWAACSTGTGTESTTAGTVTSRRLPYLPPTGD